MKKQTTLIFTILITISLSAQKISLGPELGLNIIPTENNNLGKNFQMGYHFGLNIRYHVSDKFKITTGVFLTQKKKALQINDTTSIFDFLGSFIQLSGFSEEEIDSIVLSTGANTDVRNQNKSVTAMTFIKIPLLATYRIKNFNLYAGPYVGYLLTANTNTETQTTIPLLDVFDISSLDSTGLLSGFLPASNEISYSESSNKDNLNTWDFGFNVGIGYENNNLHFNFIYSQSFLNYRTDNLDIEHESLNTFRFSLVYLFDLKQNTLSSPRLE